VRSPEWDASLSRIEQAIAAERASDEGASSDDEDVAALARVRGMLPSLKIVDEAGRLLMGLVQLVSGGWTGQPRAICLLDGRCKWPVYRSS
jgi:hypothetical protein